MCNKSLGSKFYDAVRFTNVMITYFQEVIFKISTLGTFKFKKLRLYDIHQELKARRLVSSS